MSSLERPIDECDQEYLVVTAEHYAEGYLELNGAIAFQRQFHLVKKLGRDYIVVKNPRRTHRVRD